MKKMMTLMLAGCVTLLAAQAFAADPKKEFVGSDTCKKCHAVEYKSWKETYHSKMVRPKKRHSEGSRGTPGNCGPMKAHHQ